MKATNSHYAQFQESVNAAVSELLRGYKPLRTRDNKVIRDAVFGFNFFYKHEINLLDSPILQRLRRIHQTSLAALTYPSSIHTRFEHSLGCTVIVDKMIRAVNDKHKTEIITDVQRAEVRLAALLHDCGHGPFSHASEQVFGNAPYEIAALKQERPDLFDTANPHEIIAYFIITSQAFKSFWEIVKSQYPARGEELLCNLELIDLDRVAAMILGQKKPPYPLYLSQMVNGPFDADKFDYILRDGYFSGLVTAIDIDRLFISLDCASFNEHQIASFQEDVLCVDMGGVTVLEQVLFNKMLLFSSFYHHHKIRSAFRVIKALIELIGQKELTIRGVQLKSAADFLLIDDYDVLAANFNPLDPECVEMVNSLRNRSLPRRVIVISRDTLADANSNITYFSLRADAQERQRLEQEIKQHAGLKGTIYIDLPEEPTFGITGIYSLVRIAPGIYVTLDKLYPVSGWVTGYSQYRYRGYVFANPGEERSAVNSTFEVFEQAGISLNRPLCLALAKMEPNVTS